MVGRGAALCRAAGLGRRRADVNARNARHADCNARSRCRLIVMDCCGSCAGVFGESAGSGESQRRSSANRDHNRSHLLLLVSISRVRNAFRESYVPLQLIFGVVVMGE